MCLIYKDLEDTAAVLYVNVRSFRTEQYCTY
jgi:hypothetical protein